jgi:hypothetical protein
LLYVTSYCLRQVSRAELWRLPWARETEDICQGVCHKQGDSILRVAWSALLMLLESVSETLRLLKALILRHAGLNVNQWTLKAARRWVKGVWCVKGCNRGVGRVLFGIL